MARAVPSNLYRAAAVRELDRYAIEQLDIPGYTLMCRAGAAALRELRVRWPRARRLLVLCGAGNNAGDGYVLARVARAEGLQVVTVAVVDPDRLGGDAATAYEAFVAAGGAVEQYDAGLLDTTDVVVDALLGTGLARPLDGRLLDVVRQVNAHDAPVLALDIPTGLDADHGVALGEAINADLTVTFVAPKLGLYTGAARNHTGEIRCDTLGIPKSATTHLPVGARRIEATGVARLLAPRARTAHKGDFGHLLVVGGAPGMGGAAALCAMAALRSGAGRVTVATHPVHAPALTAAQPELMCAGIAAPNDLQPLLDNADVVALGPGLGTGAWGAALYAAVVPTSLPLVVDADGLNLLAREPVRANDRVLTPHPGEAARLLGCTSADVQHDRIAALENLVARFGGTVVLKGAATLVSEHEAPPWLCDRGNPGMAAPGMGDVLTGIVAALRSQGLAASDAARTAVYAHAVAGDRAARRGERGLLARDVIDALRETLNP